jgi:3-hydroxyacyl-[acyl-carrier-protein] dehydratase
LLLNDLYTIQSVSKIEDQILVSIKLMEDHAIFKGHFPGQPVLPGVCMMEMITELTGEYLQKPFRISGGPMVKFLHMIDPKKNPLISLEIKYQAVEEKINTRGKIFYDTETFMKFELTLIPEEAV